MKRALWGVITVAAVLGACSAPTLEEMDPFARAADNTCPDGFFLYGDKQCSKKGPFDASVGTPDASDASAGEAGRDAPSGDAGNDATGGDAAGVKDAAQDAPGDAVVDANDGASDTAAAGDGSTDGAVVASKIIATPTNGRTSESGTTFQFTVELSEQPAATVTFGVTSSDAAEGTVTPSTLTFTTATWSSKQTVTVTGVADSVWDYDKSYTIVFGASTSTDPTWNGIVGPPVAMTNVDVDMPVIVLASVSHTNVQGNGQSGGLSATSGNLGPPRVADNIRVFYSSEATNFTTEDTNGGPDVFMNQRKSGQLPVTADLLGQPLREVAWNGASNQVVASSDSNYAMFHTLSTSLPTGGPGCILREVFQKQNYQVSTSTSCVPYDLSADGQYALFAEPVSGVTTLKRFDRTGAMSTAFTTVTALGSPTSASISNDGRYVAFLSTHAFQGDDTNGVADLYAVDMNSPGTFVRVSKRSDGTQLATGVTAGGLSGDGNYVWFVTRDAATATDTDADADLYLAHRTTSGSTALASRMAAAGAVGVADVSTNGRHYAFEFTPSGGNKEVWVYDRVNQTNKSAHKTYNGGVPNGATELPTISGDGIWMAYVGWASNLVAADTNGNADVFILPRP